MLQRTYRDDVHPEDLRRLKPTWARDAADLAMRQYTYRMRRSDGRYIWVESTAQPLPWGTWKAAENVVIIRDITQRQQVSDRLQESNRLLRRAEAMTHIGHWRFDPASGEIFWSEEIYRISGWPLDRTPTLQTAIEVYHPDDRAEVAALVQRALQCGESYTFDLRLVRPDGELRHVRSRGEAERSEDGRIAALVGTFQDVTESREMEARLRHRQNLEAVGQLAAGVAHDFNNILQGRAGRPGADRRRCAAGSMLHELRRDGVPLGQRGALLTHQLLSFARKQVLVRAAWPWRRSWPRCAGCWPAAGPGDRPRGGGGRSPGRRVRRSGPSADRADEPGRQCRRRHAAGGRVSIAARVDRLPGGRDWVIVAVSDTGHGMDAATLARAADPFFTTKGPSGSGLGAGDGAGLRAAVGRRPAAVQRAGAKAPGQRSCCRRTRRRPHRPARP